MSARQSSEAELPHRSRITRFRSQLSAMPGNARRWWNSKAFPATSPISRIPSFSRSRAIAWIVLMMVSACVLSLNLDYPLFEPDEARNAQLGLEIYNTGQWMTLQLGGEFYWDKPPLVAWATATSYHLLGVNEFSTRLPCNLSAILTVAMLLGAGSRLIGFRAAWCGAVMLLLSSGFVVLGRYLTMDATLTLCSTAMLLFAWIGCRGKSRRWIAAAGVACGFGLLAKGPIVCVLGLPPLITACWLEKNDYAFRPSTLFWFALPALVIALPWYTAMTIAFFPDFIEYFFWKHHVVRFSSAFNHQEPWWYFLPVIFLVMFPASILLPALIKFTVSRRDSIRQLRTREFGFMTLIVCWVVCFFSFSDSKLPTYILPAIPFACLMLGSMLESTFLTDARKQHVQQSLNRIPRPPAITLAAMVLLLQIAMTLSLPGLEAFHVSLWQMIPLSGLVIVLAVVARISRNQQIAWTSTASIAILMVSLVATTVVPAIARQRSIHAHATGVKNESASTHLPIVFYAHENYGASLWTALENQRVFHRRETSELRQYLRRHPDSIVISKPEEIRRLHDSWAGNVKFAAVKGTRHVYRVRQDASIRRWSDLRSYVSPGEPVTR